MTRYIVRRLLQAIPLLLIISLILFVLMQNATDPLATMGGRMPTKPEDRARLTRQLGLDKPIYIQYINWLVGNDWTNVDLDGDGIAETPGKRHGVLRGDFGTSIVQTGRPVITVIMERLPNTLILMLTAEVVIVLGALLVGIYSALQQYSIFDNILTAILFFGYSMPIFFVALTTMYIFSINFQRWGLPHLSLIHISEPTRPY